MTLVRTACPTCGRVQSVEEEELKEGPVTLSCRCGTSFEVTLPEKPDAAAPGEAKPKEKRKGKGEKA